MKRRDELGLAGALQGRLLGTLVGAAVFLAALAGGAVAGEAALATHWRLGAASLLTVEVPEPAAQAADSPRATRIADALRAFPTLRVRRIGDAELAGLLRPWIGGDAGSLGLELPAVFALQLTGSDPGAALDAAVAQAAPGARVSRNAAWLARLGVLAASLQACAVLALVLVGGIAGATVAVATHGALAATRPAVETLHGLGAPDAAIAGRFARRMAVLGLVAGLPGAALAVPVLLFLAGLGAPLVAMAVPSPAALALGLPATLWVGLASLPVLAAAIAGGTAQATVRLWLLQLP